MRLTADCLTTNPIRLRILENKNQLERNHIMTLSFLGPRKDPCSEMLQAIKSPDPDCGLRFEPEKCKLRRIVALEKQRRKMIDYHPCAYCPTLLEAEREEAEREEQAQQEAERRRATRSNTTTLLTWKRHGRKRKAVCAGRWCAWC